MTSSLTQPLVSVIITSYNQRHFLEKTIQSVLNQTYNNIEIIIADDCSNDDTDDYIANLTKNSRFPIEYIKQPRNIGIPKNRNSAIRFIKGKYFMILDGDDLYCPSNIEQLINKINDGFDAVYTNIDFIDENDNYIRTRDNSFRPEGYITYEIGLGIFGIMRNMIFPSVILGKVGMLDELLPRYDGYDFTFRISLYCRIGYISDVLAQYRVHSGSDSNQLKPIDHYKDLLRIRNNIRKLLTNESKLSLFQQSEILNYWNRIVYEFWLRTPILFKCKYINFRVSIILASLFGPLCIFKSYPYLEKYFINVKAKL